MDQKESLESEQMTEHLAQELLVLVCDPKTEVKYGTLNAILQYTKTEPSKHLFLETNLFEEIVKNISNPQLQKICLSTLIHFSTSEECSDKIIEHVELLINDLEKAEGLPEELGLMLLLNLSKQYRFASKIVEEHEDESKQPLIHTIHSFLSTKANHRWVIAKIFANITEHYIGREYTGLNKLFIHFIQYLNDYKESLRISVLHMLRNISFMWENDQIISSMLSKENQLIDQINIHMLIMTIKSKLISDTSKAIEILQGNYSKILDYDMEIEEELPKIKSSKEISTSEIEVCIDIITILSNSNFEEEKIEFMRDEFRETMSLIKSIDFGEEYKEKVEELIKLKLDSSSN